MNQFTNDYALDSARIGDTVNIRIRGGSVLNDEEISYLHTRGFTKGHGTSPWPTSMDRFEPWVKCATAEDLTTPVEPPDDSTVYTYVVEYGFDPVRTSTVRCAIAYFDPQTQTATFQDCNQELIAGFTSVKSVVKQ